MSENPDMATQTIDRLVAEILTIIPAMTTGRGSFNTVPALGYRMRNPGEWQAEFLALLEPRYLAAFAPDTFDIAALASLLNRWTSGMGRETIMEPNGSTYMLPTGTLATLLGYPVLEMVIRRLLRKTNPHDRGPSSIARLLRRFESEGRYAKLSLQLYELNREMSSMESTGTLDLYTRVKTVAMP